MKRWILVVFCLLISVQRAGATHERFHLFPQFADGRFPDGSYYRSTLTVISLSTGTTTCSWRLYGMTTTLIGGGSGSAFDFTLNALGLYTRTTTGDQPIQTGYVALTCDKEVYSVVLYSSYSSRGVKLAEAAVFSSAVIGEDPFFLMPFDNREETVLGVAIANNSDLQRTYRLTLQTATDRYSGTAMAPARTAVARFVHEMMPVPPNTTGVLLIESTDDSDFTVIGLRFTGAVFTTIPPY